MSTEMRFSDDKNISHTFHQRPSYSLKKIQVNVRELVSETCYSSQVNFQMQYPALNLRCNSGLWKARPRCWWNKGKVRWELVLYLCDVRKWPKWLTLILLTSWRGPCSRLSPRRVKERYWYFYYSRRGNWKCLAPSAGMRLCLLWVHGTHSDYHVMWFACCWE